MHSPPPTLGRAATLCSGISHASQLSFWGMKGLKVGCVCWYLALVPDSVFVMVRLKALPVGVLVLDRLPVREPTWIMLEALMLAPNSASRRLRSKYLLPSSWARAISCSIRDRLQVALELTRVANTVTAAAIRRRTAMIAEWSGYRSRKKFVSGGGEH